VLTGYLDLLEKIIRLDPSVVRDEAFGGNLVRTFLKEFLFTMPTDDEQDKAPICDSSSTRQAAFGVLSAYLAIAPEPFEDALQEVIDLSTSASQQIKCAWGLQVSNDVKRADVTFSGLKNQGCTCYMNSLLQQFFMNTSFRAAILNTNMRECHRSTLWHRSPEGLVGLDLLIEWQGTHSDDMYSDIILTSLIYLLSLDLSPAVD
jgi:Ubiquitin carboxyl-terminal hydrolase